MRLLKAICTIAAFLGLTATAMAGTNVYDFDPQGYSGFYRSNCYDNRPCACHLSMDTTQGNPGNSLAIHANHGFAIETIRPELTGDYKAAGHGRIALDLKVLSWYPSPNADAPHPNIFIQAANGSTVWFAPVQGFTQTLGQWQRIHVEFDPSWSDAEAKQNGWIQFGTDILTLVSFTDAMQNVRVVGVFMSITDAGAESHHRIDNFTVGPRLMTMPTKPMLKPAIKLHPGVKKLPKVPLKK